MKTRTPFRVLLAGVMTLALLPMLSSFAPGGQVGGFTTAAPAAANKIWYQSVGRSSNAAPCQESTGAELAEGWTNWAPSWEQWANDRQGGFVCSRQITWAHDTPPLTCATGGGAPGTCVIGARGPGGGIVFHVNESNSTGARYMEAAPSGWNAPATSDDPILGWGVNTGGTDCSSLDITGAVGTAIGTGLANTTAITTRCTLAQAPAAWAARSYTGGGLSVGSWFLASLGELNALYGQRTVVSADLSAPPEYWSSSQSVAGGNLVSTVDFSNGTGAEIAKVNFLRVRPVRAF